MIIHRIRLRSAFVGLLVFFTVGIPVQAADFTAGTAQELVNAITAANGNTEADTITLTADIILDGTTIFTQEGNNGLPVISSEITINGAGFEIARDTASGTPFFRIFFVSRSGNLTLTDMTVRNGFASDGSSTSTLTDIGGGISSEGTLTLNNSTISGNTAASRGGGIYNYFRGILTLNNSTVSGNHANNGGGIDSTGTLSLNNSTVSGNHANSGGGIDNGGGGLLTLNNSTVSGNTANFRGGGIDSTGTLTLSNSTISGNTAASRGGGIYNEFRTLTLTNSTVSGNTAQSGGGISSEGSLTLSNSTLSGNMAQVDSGGGILNLGGTLTLSNSIIANSTGLDYTGIGTIIRQGNNIVEDGSISGTGVTAVDPNLAPLADNGGPTQTHALQSGSRAINASGAGATTADQRGAAAAGTRDIGAYEFRGFVPAVSFAISNTTLVEDGSTTLAIITLTATGVNQIPDVEFAFTGDATADDYILVGYPLVRTSNITDTFGVFIVDDAINESTETLTLAMRVVGTLDITGSNPQTITFIDNDGTGADVNGDGIVSPSDAIYVLNRLGSGDFSADVNGDNIVDMTDYNDVLNNLGN